MSLAWLFRFSDRVHPLALPGLLLLICGGTYLLVASVTEGGQIRGGISQRSFVGTLALFTVLPGYLLGMMNLQRLRNEQALAALESVDNVSHIARTRSDLQRVRGLAVPGVLLGIVFGAMQNLGFIRAMYDELALNLMDVTFVAGNCFVWGMASLMAGWRLPVSTALSRLGAGLQLDLYRLDKLRPLTRVAPTAIVLFLLPLWGLHNNIKRSKVARLHALHAMLDETDRHDVATLETVTAHIDRVRAMPNWPIDVQTVTRVFAYVIIPPLAWVGAALVENFINSL